jgi:hypothetical protein
MVRLIHTLKTPTKDEPMQKLAKAMRKQGYKPRLCGTNETRRVFPEDLDLWLIPRPSGPNKTGRYLDK